MEALIGAGITTSKVGAYATPRAKIERPVNDEHYPRDMVGYGANPPQAKWPRSARLAVQFVINYEKAAKIIFSTVITHRKRFSRDRWR